MPVLFDVFPDANVVRLHRHPCHAVPSCAASSQANRRLFAQRIDHSRGRSNHPRHVRRWYETIDGRRATVERRHIIDIATTIWSPRRPPWFRRIYANSAIATARRSTGYGALHRARPTTARPRHTYTLEQFGLSRAQVLERSADYLAWVRQRCGELAE